MQWHLCLKMLSLIETLSIGRQHVVWSSTCRLVYLNWDAKMHLLIFWTSFGPISLRFLLMWLTLFLIVLTEWESLWDQEDFWCTLFRDFFIQREGWEMSTGRYTITFTLGLKMDLWVRTRITHRRDRMTIEGMSWSTWFERDNWNNLNKIIFKLVRRKSCKQWRLQILKVGRKRCKEWFCFFFESFRSLS